MDLSNRMKQYEQSVGPYLVYRCPAILRIDGRAFHSLTRGMKKPWDEQFIYLMQQTAVALCEEISTARFAYGQSDEISILLVDYDNLNTEQWFGGKVQKIVSIAASIATSVFSERMRRIDKWRKKTNKVCFDARVFSIPKEDVNNYFVWRQQDAVRNSILSLGYAHFSHNALKNHTCEQVQEKLWQEAKINWNDCSVFLKRGWSIYKKLLGMHRRWIVDYRCPTFTQDHNHVEQWIHANEE